MSTSHSQQRGFTLIEVMVSLALFSVVMIIAVGGFLSILDVNRKAQALQASLDNASFSFENVTRLIRTGTQFDCGHTNGTPVPSDCAGGTSLQFIDDTGRTIQLQPQTDATSTYLYQRVRDTTGVWGGWYILTAPDFKLTNILFHVVGSAPKSSGDIQQPMVTVVMTGKVNAGKKTETEIKLQTTVTQRVLDL